MSNVLNKISQVYLDQVLNVKKAENEQDLDRWTQTEAKVDKPMIFGKDAARNERRFGKKGHFDPEGSGTRGQGTSERAQLAVKRKKEHEARRGVKTKGMKAVSYTHLTLPTKRIV